MIQPCKLCKATGILHINEEVYLCVRCGGYCSFDLSPEDSNEVSMSDYEIGRITVVRMSGCNL